MPIYASSGPTYELAPAGTHAAICCDVVDLGIIKVEYAGKAKSQHKIYICWQIADEDGRAMLNSDGRPFTVRKRYTLSLHEKSTLRKDLESWRGRPFTEQEAHQFDVETLLGVGCLLQVMHTDKNGRTYDNIAAIMRLPKNMAAPQVRDYVRVCERQPTEAGAVPPPDEQYGPGITDDDIPF